MKRSANLIFLEALARRCQALGLYAGEAGSNLDFHAIRHHGGEVPLEEHYVPASSKRRRSILTFFAQDHASTEMVYANADVTEAEQAKEVLALAEYWRRVSGHEPGLVVFDSKLTNYTTSTSSALGASSSSPSVSGANASSNDSRRSRPRRGRPTICGAPAATAAPRSTRR